MRLRSSLIMLLITVCTMLLTVSCSGGSETETAQVSPSASTLTSAPIPTASVTEPIPTATQVPSASTAMDGQTISKPAQVAASAPKATVAQPTPPSTQAPSTSIPIPTTGLPIVVTVCDWELSYVIRDGFLHLAANEAPGIHNIQNLFIEYTPAIRRVNHPIFNQTGGFALHEYSKERLDVSKTEHQVAIPKAKTAYRMDLKIMLVSSTPDGRNCQEELHAAFTRSDDYYPSPELLLPDNAFPNRERYAGYLDKIPAPNAQSVVLATSMGDWNGNWETMLVRKVEVPVRIGFFGDVGPEDYETVRDLLEILVVVAPDLDIGYANSLDEVTLPIHFVECTEMLNRDANYCKLDGPSGSLSGRLVHDGTGTFWIRISGQRFNRHTLTHEMGHALGLFHWNLENASMGYGRAQTQWWSEWDLMAISAIHHSASDWWQSRDSMREALGVAEDVGWIRYTEDPDLLSDTPDSTWVELANLLKIQTIEAVGRTEPKY